MIAARVAAARGIFFAGGAQHRIVRALGGTKVGAAVQAAFERGAVVGGTSAGTACQSGLMITGEGDFSMLVNLNQTVGTIRADKAHMPSTPFGERFLEALPSNANRALRARGLSARAIGLQPSPRDIARADFRGRTR